MTSLAPSNIPSSANPATGGSLERLFMWAGLALKAANGTRGAVESDGGSAQPVMQYQIYEAPDGQYRLILRANLRLDPTYITDPTKRLWEFSQELTTGSIPSTYL